MVTCKKIYMWFFNKWLVYKIGITAKSFAVKDPMGLIMLYDWQEAAKNL